MLAVRFSSFSCPVVVLPFPTLWNALRGLDSGGVGAEVVVVVAEREESGFGLNVGRGEE